MALEIVWRNPYPPQKTEKWVDQVVADEFGALYAVRIEGETASFEVILGGAA